MSATCERAEKIGRTAGERAVRRLNPRKVASQTVPVIFDRRVATSLVGHLLGAINGAAIARGTSFLKNDLGKPIFAGGRHHRRGSVAPARPGIAPLRWRGPCRTHARNIIENGVLTNWILDLRSARQLGLEPTGQGSAAARTTAMFTWRRAPLTAAGADERHRPGPSRHRIHRLSASTW